MVWKHGRNRCHDSWGRPVLPRIESCLDEENQKEDNSQSKVCWGWRVSQRFPADEYKYTTNQQNRAKASKEIAEYLPAHSRRRSGRKISTVFSDAALDLFRGKTLLLRSGKTIEELIDGNGMPFQISKFYRPRLAFSFFVFFFPLSFFFFFLFPFFYLWEVEPLRIW